MKHSYPGMTGKKHSEETKRKLSLLNKGLGLGRKLSEETKAKISAAKIGIKNTWSKPPSAFGLKRRPETLLKMSGENHWNWQGGLEKNKTHRIMLQHKREERKRENGGSFTVGEWETLKAQYNWTCPACKREEPNIKLTVDHIIPTIKGGSNNIENIQPLCGSCNSSKKIRIIKY